MEFQHQNTFTIAEDGVRDEVEVWERTKSDESGSSEVSIGWISGRVVIKKYVKASKKNSDGVQHDRLAFQEEFKLTSTASIETIARRSM